MIIEMFKPDSYLENVYELDLKEVALAGFELIMCDIDNTLVAHDSPLPNDKVFSFINECKTNQLKLVFISNNNKERVSTFAQACGIDYFYFSTKPLKRQYKKILKKYKIDHTKAMVIGDQIMTDILGGKRMSLYTVLCDPLYKKDITFTKINRIFEKMVYDYLEKKGYLIKGEYYGYKKM